MSVESNSIPDPPTMAQRLFNGFLAFDKGGVDLTVIEGEEDREGLKIMNRVRKAAIQSRWLKWPHSRIFGMQQR